MTTEEIHLIDYLREIEDITDLNGCFFVNVEDYTVIESTIPFYIPEEILWELSVLRDTFQQFATGFSHGTLQELTIEGDRGYIMLYNVPPHLILLAMGAQDINLNFVKLAMIDVLKNIRKEIFDMGDAVLKIPSKGFGKVGAKVEKVPEKEVSISKVIVPEPVTEPTAPELVKPEPIQEPVGPEITPEIEMDVETTQAQTIPPTEQVESEAAPKIKDTAKIGILDLINSIEEKSSDEKYIVIKNIFSLLKEDLSVVTGSKFSEILEKLKDAILEHVGTSLALFDISRCSRDLSKNHDKFTPNEIKRYAERIDNWESRIIKL